MGKKNKSKGKKRVAKEPNSQLGSLFMRRLPPEIRLEIYSHYFFSTRLAWGERALGRIDRQRIGSAPNSLALLLLFSFESAEAMLDKLANIPTSTLALIRHVRVSGDPLMISWEDDDVFYRTSQTLKLLPVDRFTVLASRTPEVRSQTLDMLIRQCTGWKELVYLSHDSRFLGYQDSWWSFAGASDEDRYLRVPQPAGWQRVLEERDDANTGTSVTIYRATSPRACSVLLQPDTRAAFAQTLPAGKTLKTFGKEADAALMAQGEREKEVLVVVRRGCGADYAEKEGSPYLEEPAVVDAYTHVDEY
ncbi:hypothetical protein DFH08DRAFT_917314 [Mycena albidolilacea]|uniref:Uncharacterized protein n=1 Tax=Mycena albidolilacea TaxID=1033008 RepID=A0AAD7EFH6_9AGAR|nr:hypothetical protein DFH08DRAFT_917314 [Mycena albidolilacea]